MKSQHIHHLLDQLKFAGDALEDGVHNPFLHCLDQFPISKTVGITIQEIDPALLNRFVVALHPLSL